jgi:hypothetical protein
MKERPVLFSAPMVRALLREENPKSQTRRIVKPQPDAAITEMDNTDPVKFWQMPGHSGVWWDDDATGRRWRCPYGAPGDRLWVRESFHLDQQPTGPLMSDERAVVTYKADHPGDANGLGWKPSIHLPRRYSRITLEVLSVRVERLQAISEEDAKAEGVEASDKVEMKDGSPCYALPYRILWEQINGVGSWESNPFVWCITFRRIQP